MIKVQAGLTVLAADGTALVADLVLPDRLPAPAVVIRTPYGTAGCLPEALSFAEAGLACLTQDLRGRHLSAGSFAVGADETSDGHTTLDWVAGQPWCDGRVFLYGVAYEAYAAWCAAGHPAVRGVISRQPWPPIGRPALDEELWWRTELARPGLFDVIEAREPGLDVADWPVGIEPWPPTPSTYKPAARRAMRAARSATVPSLHLGSWYCRSAATTVRQAMLVRQAEVVIGGWAGPLTHRLQDECALEIPVEPHPFELALAWLAGQDVGRCLLQGSARWSATDPLPPRRTSWIRPELKGDGGALIHEPARPYPSVPHSADLAPLPEGDGVVRLTAEGPLVWHGIPRVTAGSSAGSPVELVATLVHERPDGVATRLTDGTAPAASHCDIRLAPGAVELPPGHRLHLELTAGRPPRYPAPRRATRIELREVALHLPRPRNGAFA